MKNKNIEFRSQWDKVLKYSVNMNNVVPNNPLYFSRMSDVDLNDLDNKFMISLSKKESPMYKFSWKRTWVDSRKVKFLMDIGWVTD